MAKKYPSDLSPKALARAISNDQRFPTLSRKVKRDPWDVTVPRKHNGGQYGHILEKGLPMLESWVSQTDMHPMQAELLSKIEYHGRGTYTPIERAVLCMVGRTEGAHSRGKKVLTIMLDAVTAESVNIVLTGDAENLIANMERINAIIKSQAEKPAEKPAQAEKPAPKTRTRRKATPTKKTA